MRLYSARDLQPMRRTSARQEAARPHVLLERAIAMTRVQQKAQPVLWLAEFKSVITVQRTSRRVYGGDLVLFNGLVEAPT